MYKKKENIQVDIMNRKMKYQEYQEIYQKLIKIILPFHQVMNLILKEKVIILKVIKLNLVLQMVLRLLLMRILQIIII